MPPKTHKLKQLAKALGISEYELEKKIGVGKARIINIVKRGSIIKNDII
jgi:predicted transcriptional regulator